MKEGVSGGRRGGVGGGVLPPTPSIQLPGPRAAWPRQTPPRPGHTTLSRLTLGHLPHCAQTYQYSRSTHCCTRSRSLLSPPPHHPPERQRRCMFVYVSLSALLVAVQLRAVRLREARLFKDHYEACQQATQLQTHTLGAATERMNESSRMSRVYYTGPGAGGVGVGGGGLEG